MAVRPRRSLATPTRPYDPKEKPVGSSGTVSRADGFVNDMNSYLDPMKNPTAGDARCEDYKVSDGAAAGNTATLNAQGVYLFQVAVQMFGDLDYIVVQASIGPNVVITQTA